MPTHPDARLRPIGRERLIPQHLTNGRSGAQLAVEHSISERVFSEGAQGPHIKPSRCPSPAIRFSGFLEANNKLGLP